MVKINALGYVVAQSTDLSKWKAFAEQVLGMQTAPAPDGGLYLKMDEREFRIAVVPGPADSYFASGWEVDARDFDHAVAALRKAGVDIVQAGADVCAARKAQKVIHFQDPSGNRHELSSGYAGKTAPFASPIGVKGFKTGEFGAGHTVLPSLQFDASLKFFRDVLGFGLSDFFNFRPAPEAPVMRIYFLHTPNGRHHSLALAEMPHPANCVHLMVEVQEKDEVERGLKRMEKAGVKLMATLGQHENDRMTSFYMLTPGNFAIEYGWGGITVDPKTHQTTETKQVSIWGHDFSVGFR
ncbi:MAG TPA: VOC family protein [Candidatus Binatia bacterium]|nr:VOC family protein [Candidatus Binatia bacterium]